MDSSQTSFSRSDSWDLMGPTHRPVPEKVWGSYTSCVAGAILAFWFCTSAPGSDPGPFKEGSQAFGLQTPHLHVSQFIKDRKQKHIMSHNNMDAPSQGQLLHP